MKTLVIKISDSAKLDVHEAKMVLASHLYEKEK